MGFEDAKCRVDAKRSITAITIDVALVFTNTSETAEDGSYAVETKTTNVSDTFHRVRTSDLRGKFYGTADITGYALLVEASPGVYPTLTFTKLTNPQCRYDQILMEFDEWTFYPDGLFNEEWQPSHALIDAYRAAVGDEDRATALAALKAEWLSHSVWKPGYFMLLCPPCCPCMIELTQYAVPHKGATAVHFSQWDGEGNLVIDYDDDYEDWTTVIPHLVTRNCKSELGMVGGARYDPDDNETSPATFAVTSVVAGDETHDAEVEIRVNETGVPDVRVEFSWVSPGDEADVFVFYLTPGEIILFSLNGDDGSTYLGSDRVAWQAKMDAIVAENFRLTTGTKSDGERGVWRIGFIGKYARTPVALPAYCATFIPRASEDEVKVVRPAWGGDDGYSDYLDFYDQYYYTTGTVSRVYVVPDYRYGFYPTGAQVQDPRIYNFLNVARCMSDAGSSWSRTFDNTQSYAHETHRRVGHITYSW